MTQQNKIINVSFIGGIIGLLGNSPQNILNRRVRMENAEGWEVVQLIPAASGNILLLLLRIFILLITMFFYTKTNGYYVVLKRIGRESSTLQKDNNLSIGAKILNTDNLFE